MERGLLAEMKSLHLRGEEEIQESSFILYKHELFQIVVRHYTVIKWLTNPAKQAYLFFCTITVKFNQACGAYGLVYKEDRLLALVVSSPWLLGGHLRLYLWSVKVLIVHWDTMGPDGSHLSWRLALPCSC